MHTTNKAAALSALELWRMPVSDCRWGPILPHHPSPTRHAGMRSPAWHDAHCVSYCQSWHDLHLGHDRPVACALGIRVPRHQNLFQKGRKERGPVRLARTMEGQDNANQGPPLARRSKCQYNEPAKRWFRRSVPPKNKHTQPPHHHPHTTPIALFQHPLVPA